MAILIVQGKHFTMKISLRYGPGSGLASAGSVVTENVTAQLGITTYLHCRVNNLGGKMVSGAWFS